jgi:putative IMPACT (imprinted ancient) family translation regulator
MCILRELQRADFVNGIMVVTRYFWGIHLGTDRFKNVILASQKGISEIRSHNHWQI